MVPGFFQIVQFIRTENLVSFRSFFLLVLSRLSYVWPLCRKAQCCSAVCPSARFASLHTLALELNQSDLKVLGHLSHQNTSPRWLSFARRLVLRRLVPVFFLVFFAFLRSVSELCRQFI